MNHEPVSFLHFPRRTHKKDGSSDGASDKIIKENDILTQKDGRKSRTERDSLSKHIHPVKKNHISFDKRYVCFQISGIFKRQKKKTVLQISTSRKGFFAKSSQSFHKFLRESCAKHFLACPCISLILKDLENFLITVKTFRFNKNTFLFQSWVNKR